MFVQDIILQKKRMKEKEETITKKRYMTNRIIQMLKLMKQRNREYFNPNKTFYVCSYGGSGSTVLTKYLRFFGNVQHIHSRVPPEKLKYIGKKNTTKPVYNEWFNSVSVPDKELDQYKVIFIYRNPVESILSRFDMKIHLQHIQCPNVEIKIKDVLEKKQDLYNLEEFYNNYTTPNAMRNYKIHCVKYENFFENIKEFNQTMDIPDIEKMYPLKKEREKKELSKTREILGEIYKNMKEKIEAMPFIQIL